MNIAADPARVERRPMAPPPLARLFEAFDAAAVAWCCWKGARSLAAAFAGRSDLDLLIARADRQRATQCLVARGFRHAPDAADRDDPAMESFLGLDPDSGALLHVHAHFRLILGPALLKTWRLPLEAAFLARARRDSGVRRLAPEDAALLLLVRRALEFSLIDPVRAARREEIDEKFRADFSALASACDAERLRGTAREIFPPTLADEIVAALAGDPLAGARALRGKIGRALAPFRGAGAIEAGARHGVRVARFLFAAARARAFATPRARKRRAPGGGAVIAFVGVDGSGKSTAARRTREWLGEEIDVLQIYFGTGDGAASALLTPFKPMARLVGRFIRVKPKGASHGRISDKPPGPLYSFLFAIWAAAVALDKRHKLIVAQRAARRGMIVVTDRWPQDEIESFNDGPLLHRLPRAPEWLRAFERAIYARARHAPPDLVVKLMVGAEAVRRREPDMSEALIPQRLACVEALRFSGARLVSIDARAPLDDVTRAVRQAVWTIV